MNRAIDAGLPKTIRVMGQRFAVRVTKDLRVSTGDIAERDVHDEWVHENTMAVLGVCDRDALVIALDSETGHDRFRETLLHESLHAMVAKAHLNQDLLASSEEAVVARLVPILLQFVRDNPRVMEFLRT